MISGVSANFFVIWMLSVSPVILTALSNKTNIGILASSNASLHHHHHNEGDKNSNNLDSPGDPYGPEHSLDFGEHCIKSNPKACKYFPDVTCVWVEENIFVCRCDFLHKWNFTTKTCIVNAFSPCSDSRQDCGPNMECRFDTVGSNPNEKMCRCKTGYMLEIDYEGLPTQCIVDHRWPNDDEEKLNQNLANHGSTKETKLCLLTAWFIVVVLTTMQ